VLDARGAGVGPFVVVDERGYLGSDDGGAARSFVASA